MSQKSQELEREIGEIQQLEQNLSKKIHKLEDRFSKEMAEMKKSLLIDMKKLLLENRTVK